MRRVPCCYKTAWENDEECGFFEPGKQKEIRRIENPDMCVVDATDDLSSETYTPCCYKTDWSYAGENLDGQLGKVKEVREVYNCPPEEKDKQYEKEVCYIGGFEDYACNGEFRQQRRTVLNCPVGTERTRDIEEDRPQETTMNHCYNISGVTIITVGGTSDFTEYVCKFVTRKRDDNTGLLGEDILVVFNEDSPAGTLDFDPPRDIRAVLAYGKTYGKDGKLEMKFWNGDVLIRKMHIDVEKRTDFVLSYADAEKMIVTGGKHEPRDSWKRRYSLKPMIEDFT
jgi:hypothetical protein